MFLLGLLKRRRLLRTSLVLLVLLPVCFFLISFLGLHARVGGSWSDAGTEVPVPMGYGIVGRAASSLTSSSSDSTKDVQQNCVHPQLVLWHPEMKPYFVKPTPLQCDNVEKNWVFTASGRFYISKEAADKHGGKIECKIFPFRRGANDFAVSRGDYVKPFPNGSVLVSDVFEAQCVARDGKTSTMVLSGVAPKPEVRERAASVKSLPESALGLDVFMFGFDSVSRLTWIRNLPKTYKYFVEELGGVVMEGYNIVGDGTPQALLPMLTGQTEVELPEARRGFSGGKTVDNHPWIWKDFSKLGYATQWGEDSAGFGTFTYRMLGFNSQPVDHYMRTFYLEAEKHYRLYRKNCLGSLPRHLNMMNYMRDFIDVYSSQRKFSFVFHAEYSHDGFSDLKLADDDLLDYLKYLKDHGHLDNALLVLMADHGARFHQMRTTEQGKYEERMPFFGLRLPEKFIASHPEAANSLRVNAHRLTTPFDIYATFRDVIDYGGDKSDVSEDVTKPLPRGISLFKEIPKRRSCADAAIEPHWCGCLTWVVVPSNDPIAARAAATVVSTINQATTAERASCSEVNLAQVHSAVRYSTSDQVLRFSGSSDIHGRTPKLLDKMNKSEDLYQVTFKTEPGGGIFEATVRHLLRTGVMTVELSAVSRINRYGKHPHCVAERLPHLRPYCYCRLQLKTENNADGNRDAQQEIAKDSTGISDTAATEAVLKHQ